MDGADDESALTLGEVQVALGERRDIELPISESFTGQSLHLPLRVWRAEAPGPTVLVSAAVHGNELNGTGVIRRLINDPPFNLLKGTLVLVPVVNVLGFERHMRYMPDRRDLNRAFPGYEDGSLTGRFAHSFFNQVVKRCDYCIDLHTAAVHRTNFPNVRADLRNPDTARLSAAFGWVLVLNGNGPVGSLRRTASEHGVPTIILEAGEPSKIEPMVLHCALWGIRNALAALGMSDDEPLEDAQQIWIERSLWMRAESGGMVDFHVRPGDVVEQDQAVATSTDLFGRQQHVQRAPRAGIVLGMTTMPAANPGEPLIHLAVSRMSAEEMRRRLSESPASRLLRRIHRDLATSIAVSDHPFQPGLG